MSLLYLLPLLSLLTSSFAHIQLVDPYPILSPANPAVPWDKKNYNMMAPLTWDGDSPPLPYPCKGYLQTTSDEDRISQKTWPAGSTQTLSFGLGGAPHLGGSCQVVLSYDSGATWQVIYSYIGGCMIEGFTWSFPIPAEAPSGTAVLGWNWFNNQGNREMYQNCAIITIEGGGEGLPMGDDYPPPFVANAGKGVNACSTVEGVDVVFPKPGKNVKWSGGYKGKAQTSGKGVVGEQCWDGTQGKTPAGSNGLIQGREEVVSVSSTSASSSSSAAVNSLPSAPSASTSTASPSLFTGIITPAESSSAVEPSSFTAPSSSASEAAPTSTSHSISSLTVQAASSTSSPRPSASGSSLIVSTPPSITSSLHPSSTSTLPGEGYIALPPPSGTSDPLPSYSAEPPLSAQPEPSDPTSFISSPTSSASLSGSSSISTLSLPSASQSSAVSPSIALTPSIAPGTPSSTQTETPVSSTPSPGVCKRSHKTTIRRKRANQVPVPLTSPMLRSLGESAGPANLIKIKRVKSNP